MMRFIPKGPLEPHERRCGAHQDMEAGMNRILTSHRDGPSNHGPGYIVRGEENDCWYDYELVDVLMRKMNS